MNNKLLPYMYMSVLGMGEHRKSAPRMNELSVVNIEEEYKDLKEAYTW